MPKHLLREVAFSLTVPAARGGNVKLELMLCGEAAGAAPDPGGIRASPPAFQQLCAHHPCAPSPLHQALAAGDTHPVLAQVCDTQQVWKVRLLHLFYTGLGALPGQTFLHSIFRSQNSHLYVLTL